MALSPIAIMSVADLKRYQSISSGQDDEILEDIINRLTEFFETRLGALKQRVYTDYLMAGPSSTMLAPPAVPIDISQPLTVTVGGVAQTVWKSAADGDRASKDVCVSGDVEDTRWRPNLLYRAAGWGTTRPSDPWNVVLTYTGGFATIPGELLEAFGQIAEKLYRERKHGTSEVISMSSPAGSVVLPDRFLPDRAWRILRAHERVRV